MASTGILYRRNTKANLTANPPIVGEIVFATDTEEYGALESGVIVWEKHSRAAVDTSLDVTNFNGVLSATDNTYQKAFDTIDNIQTDLTSSANHILATNNPHGVTATQVGLDLVDNTSDASKPVSTAQQSALDLKEDSTNKGAINGYASLDGNALVPTTQLPSFVDDVLEFTDLASFPATGETGKIYIALDTNKTYRWSGSVYVYITSGAVDSVAGKTGIVTLTKSDVGLANVDNTSDLSKPISTATQTALDGKIDDGQVLTDVPAGALFTDTIYNDTSLSGRVTTLEGTDHTHANSIVLDATTASYTTAEETKLAGIEDSANNYVHPTGDGNLHVPATSTTNDGKVLTAGATAGALTWETPTPMITDHTLFTNIGTNTHAQIDTHIADSTTHFTQSSISITESQISDFGVYLTSETSHADVLVDSDAVTPVTGVNKLITQSDVAGLGGGDMLTSVYDNSGTVGIVDNAEKVNNLTVETAVPAGAVFTDTTYLPSNPGTNGTDGVDGLLTDADKFKLDNIETGATADQIAADVPYTNTTSTLLATNVQTALDEIEGRVDTIEVGAGTAWGGITGTLSSQTDLQTALDGKIDDGQVLTDVPAGALFTDTVYDDTTINTAVVKNTNVTGTTTLIRHDKVISNRDIIATGYDVENNLILVRYSGDNDSTIYYRDVLLYTNGSLVNVKHYNGTANLITESGLTTLTYTGDNLSTSAYTE